MSSARRQRRTVYRRVVRVLLSALTFAVSVIANNSAHAQPSQADVRQPRRDTRTHDAHTDRAVVVPTAETHPEGTLFLSAYELVIPSIGYAFTDDLQVSATGFTDFKSGIFELRAKANLVRGAIVRLSVGTSLDYFASEPDGDADEGADSDVLLGRADVALQLCFEPSCRSSLSTAATIAPLAQTELLLPVAFGSALTLQATTSVSLLLEYFALINAAEDFGLLPTSGHFVSYGARLAWDASWAVDLAFLRSIGPQTEVRVVPPDLIDIMGLPFVAITYRFALLSPRSSTTYQ